MRLFSLWGKMDSLQYNTVLAITGAVTVTSKDKLYQELGLETLQLLFQNIS